MRNYGIASGVVAPASTLPRLVFDPARISVVSDGVMRLSWGPNVGTLA
jgi:hypothetical protein